VVSASGAQRVPLPTRDGSGSVRLRF
jgi:hypothetical protein